jgi:hypothetical protein
MCDLPCRLATSVIPVLSRNCAVRAKSTAHPSYYGEPVPHLNPKTPRDKTQLAHPPPCRPPAPLCGQSPPHARPSSGEPVSHLTQKPRGRKHNVSILPVPSSFPQPRQSGVIASAVGAKQSRNGHETQPLDCFASQLRCVSPPHPMRSMSAMTIQNSISAPAHLQNPRSQKNIFYISLHISGQI